MSTDESVTILTVAAKAGVSKTTASDALRGSGRVSEATRDRVRKAADALGFVPNGSARHLRRASTGTIGLHLPSVLTRSNYYMPFVFGVVERAAHIDYDVTLITSGLHRRAPRVDGLVLGDPLTGDPVVERLMSSGLPVVTCERFPGDIKADGVVRSDHVDGVRQLLDHLAAQGAKMPGLVVAGDESDWAASVNQGYLAWCAEHEIQPRSQKVPFDAPADAVRAATLALLDPRLDALVAAPAGAAVDLLPTLTEAGLSVGRDLLLASGVDSPPMRSANPPITALDLRPREAGDACAALLFDLLNGSADPGTERRHPIDLVVRASTGGGPLTKSST